MTWAVVAVDPGEKAGVSVLEPDGSLSIFAVSGVGGSPAMRRQRMAAFASEHLCGYQAGTSGFALQPYDLLAIEFWPRKGARAARTNGWLGVAAGLWHVVDAKRCRYVNANWKQRLEVLACIEAFDHRFPIEYPSDNARDSVGVLLAALLEVPAKVRPVPLRIRERSTVHYPPS